MLQPRSFLFTRAPAPSPSSRSRRSSYERPGEQSRPVAKREPLNISSASIPTERSTPLPSSPVVIPLRAQQDSSRERTRPHRAERTREVLRAERRRNVHSPDAIPPPVAALLALTSIPPQKASGLRRRSGASQRLTVDAVLEHTASEKQFGLTLGKEKGPLDFLLSPPDDEYEVAVSDTGRGSVFSTRSRSSESIPSLDGISVSETSPSFCSLTTPGSRSSPRGRRSTPSRRMQSLSPSLSLSPENHPLFEAKLDVDELDFRAFQKVDDSEKQSLEAPVRKSAFKSNLTASLRALKSAARTFSNLATPMITPDDFLTRSIISIDPQVPFTDERMPPLLEDMPTPALRRYLNPTTNAPIEAHVPKSLTQTMGSPTCTASIQMQTYKVSRSPKGTSLSVISRRTQPTSEDVSDSATGPVARQRDMRENSDFMRVAVMEMLMRKKGKLDDQRPGRARWALPPRKPQTKQYEISENGIPVRWVAVTT
ncbi:hypothetical protein QTJ16_002227 [Diplocarpon rosae]|uniref:Uncharacterized protein n=1 Tax=Diplocarpon rosae TaxID=946125 RepID=A0AAD9T5U5_9HELO|nr:hypothetical protein QTJ16_002227 [Diplocarpon rosae]